MNTIRLLEKPGLLLFLTLFCSQLFSQPVKVVSSLPDYASIAKLIGRERVSVASIAKGNQDAHFVRAKPSFARLLSEADLFLTTGLDLELWVPALLDRSRNPRIREGGAGYVSVSQNVPLAQIPRNPDRSGGDIHVYGNPHIHTDPLRGILIGENVLAGLLRVDATNASEYQRNFEEFKNEIHRRLYGDALVQVLGGEQLAQLSWNNRLGPYLASTPHPPRHQDEHHEADHHSSGIQTKPLESLLGGWMKEAACLEKKQLVAFHRNWIYFTQRFGLRILDYVEYRPGIPASARHIHELIEKMRRFEIRALLTANYYDQKAPAKIALESGVSIVSAPLSVGGAQEAGTYLDLFDIWIGGLKRAYPECRSGDV